ncbi:MAG: hypothetical protein ACRDQ5_24865, partial [Sciscionella sp.]
WVMMDSLRTRRQERTQKRMARRYQPERNDDMGRHSLRGDEQEHDEYREARFSSRGCHALDDRDDVLIREWPSDDPDEPTEVLPVSPSQTRAEADTVSNLNLRRARAALDAPWPEQQPAMPPPRTGPRHRRDTPP